MQLTARDPDRHGARLPRRSGVPLALATFALGGVLVLAGPVTAADKPNILVVWGDDIGQSNISAYSKGMVGYKTPNIDRIANEGMLFTTITPSSPAPPDVPPSCWARACSVPSCSFQRRVAGGQGGE